MDQMSDTLSELLNSPEGMKKVQELAQSLGLGGPDAGSPAPKADPPEPPAQSESAPGGLDLSALSGMLSALLGGGPNADVAEPPAAEPAPSGGPDLSGLSQMLSGLMGGGNAGGAAPQATAAPPASGGFDLSVLSGMLPALLGGGNAGGADAGAASAPGLDINMLLKAKDMMGQFSKDDKNTLLLKALRPHLSDKRKPKVDDALKILRLIELLPLLKQSGLLGGLGNLFGGGDSG